MTGGPTPAGAGGGCPACGADGVARHRDPSVGLGFVLLGAGVCIDALRGAWDPGLDGIHSILGGTVLAVAVWGLARDMRTLGRAGGGAGSRLWIEVRTRCGACGHRDPAARDLTVLRGVLGFALAAFLLAAVAR